MRAVFGIVFALAWAGDADAQNFKFEAPPPAVAAPVAQGSTRPIALARVAANIAAGTPWAEMASGNIPFPCTRDEVLKWREADNAMSTETFARVLRDEFKAAGFATSGDPTNLFEGDAARPELQLGALITNLRLRSCYVNALTIREVWDTNLLMGVEWQVYSVTQAKIVARIATAGGFRSKAKNPGAAELLSGGFADNVRLLTQNEEFRRVMSRGPEAEPAVAQIAAGAVAINFVPRAPGKVALNAAVQSVVSIFAGDSLGSGVLISSDGYILTNHHVAGSTGKVRVRWADGVDSVGEVIRANARRDVALIKAAPRAVALNIRYAPAQLGETVFAVGTPLDKSLAGTLTRGVVSSNRQLDGQPWIQSDVAVTHGNSGGPLLDEAGAILGLTDWGVAPNGASANINFFIPIDDALRVLALKADAGHPPPTTSQK